MNGPNRVPHHLAIAFASCSLALTPAAAATWAGTETVENGVTWVRNPVDPSEGRGVIELKELWRIGGDTDAEGEFFGVLNQITTDEAGNVYLLDRQLTEVKVFSPDGEYLRTIGHEGEGPGEFERPSDLFLTPDGNVAVVQGFPGKIVLLSKDGTPAGEYPTPSREQTGLGGFQGGRLAGDHIVLMGRGREFQEGSMTFLTAILQSEAGKETARYLDLKAEWKATDKVIDETDSRGWRVAWDVLSDGRVAANWEWHDYAIHVWNADGTKDRVIDRVHEPYPRTDQEKERAYRRLSPTLRWVQGGEIKVAETGRVVESVHARPDGTLWVLTNRGARTAPKGAIATFDVFDAKGRFVQQITLEGEGDPEKDGFFFSGDRFYVVTGLVDAQDAARGGGTSGGYTDEELDEDPEPVAVICYQLSDSPLVMQ